MKKCGSVHSYNFDFLLDQTLCEAGRVTLLLQIHLHELLDGQLTGGRVLKLYQSDAGKQ